MVDQEPDYWRDTVTISLRVLKSLGGLLVILSLTACTAKMSYRFLDWAVAWSIDDYVNWNREQQIDFDRRLDKQLLWHQATQLPKYSHSLQALQQDLATPLSEAVLDKHFATFTNLYSNILVNITPDASALLAQLSDEQVSKLLNNIDSKIEEDSERYSNASAEKLRKERIDRVKKMLKRWAGSYTPEQKQLISNWEENLETIWPQWVQNRRLWRDRFAGVLTQRSSATFEAQLSDLFSDPQANWSDEYIEKSTANTATTMQLVIALHNSMSDKQRKHLDKQLAYWASAFSELASEVNEARLASR